MFTDHRSRGTIGLVIYVRSFLFCTEYSYLINYVYILNSSYGVRKTPLARPDYVSFEFTDEFKRSKYYIICNL